MVGRRRAGAAVVAVGVVLTVFGAVLFLTADLPGWPRPRRGRRTRDMWAVVLAGQLGAVLDELRQMGSDPDRQAHVARKHADLLRSVASMDGLKVRAGQLAGWIDSLLTVPGAEGQQDVTADRALRLLNPTSILRLGSAVLTLGSAIGDVLLVAPPPRELVLSPENEEIYQRQKAAAEAAKAEQERLDNMSDEERAAYEAEERARRDAELESFEAQLGDR